VFLFPFADNPFLLLSSGIYLRSSERLYKKVIENRFIGNYIKEFQIKKGMTIRQKIVSISLMWTMILISCFFFISSAGLQGIILSVGLAGTIVMGFFVKTV
jgi:uncharacterized membrane protein YbaN (DUF454 family)